jgi:hypothetical protein
MDLKPLTVDTILRIAIGNAHAMVRSKMVGSGRTHWRPDDFDLAVRTLCRNMSNLPPPYPEMAEAVLRKHKAQSSEPPQPPDASPDRATVES